MKCALAEIEISYETYGAGRPLVILPGQPSERPIAEALVVAQTPEALTATHTMLAEEIAIADHAFLNREEAAGGFSFDVDAPPAPFGAPTLVLDRAGHLATFEQEALCHALVREWLDRVKDAR